MEHWTNFLPIIHLELRCPFKPDTGSSLPELVFGTTLCLPFEFFIDWYGRHVLSYYQKSFVCSDLKTCDQIVIRDLSVQRSLSPPYKVIHRYSKNFTVNIKDTAVDISTDRLKPAYFAADPNWNTEAAPPLFSE